VADDVRRCASLEGPGRAAIFAAGPEIFHLPNRVDLAALASAKGNRMPSVISSSSVVVAPRNNLTELKRIDAAVSGHLDAMVQSAVSIREAAAHIVVAGVLMTEIMNADLTAWEEFVQPFQFRVKGEYRAYREIASVLLRGFTKELQGDGSLPLRSVSRDQVCRYGAAIAVAHRWFAEGCTDPDKLAERIVKNGGVWELAKQHTQQREIARLTSTEPSEQTQDQPVRLTVGRPLVPILILVLPDGSHRPVPQELAEPVIAQVLH
jgi:hypothetical protein